MPLLHEIQTSLVQRDAPVGPALLQFRLLAAKIGSEEMESWVKLETEGYPSEIEVPDYREVGVTYRGTFSGGALGPQMNNVQIPTYLIEQHAGKSWTHHQIKESLTAIDGLIESARNSGLLTIDASNLILRLQGKVYKGLACNDVTGTIGVSSLIGIQNTVRSRLLEMTIELERELPQSARVRTHNQ